MVRPAGRVCGVVLALCPAHLSAANDQALYENAPIGNVDVDGSTGSGDYQAAPTLNLTDPPPSRWMWLCVEPARSACSRSCQLREHNGDSFEQAVSLNRRQLIDWSLAIIGRATGFSPVSLICVGTI